jgi:hypothetical protein
MNNSKAKEVAERVANDVGGAFMMALAYIGVRLGLFEGLAEGPTTSAELATRLSLNERYVREWLKAMVANEYAEYDGACYFMTDEQRVVLADETSPLFVGGSFHLTLPSVLHTPRVLEAFRDGGGVSFDEMGHEVAQGIDRLHMPAFEHQLVQDWLAGVPGLHERLESGVRVLDAGCGLGRSSKVIARAYPASTVTALDPDPWSIARAREMCRGLDNVVFAQNKLEALDANGGFELILFWRSTASTTCRTPSGRCAPFASYFPKPVSSSGSSRQGRTIHARIATRSTACARRSARCTASVYHAPPGVRGWERSSASAGRAGSPNRPGTPASRRSRSKTRRNSSSCSSNSLTPQNEREV